MKTFHSSINLNTGSSKKSFCRALVYMILLTVSAQSNAHAQTIDTVAMQTNTDTSSWNYKMEQSDDRWFRTAKRKDFQLFYKHDYNRTAGKNPHSGNVSYYGNATLFWLNDIKQVEVAAAGVTRENANDFIYHVTVNDSIEIVPWSKPVNFRSNKHITYAYLGKFDTQNKIIKLDFFNVKNYKERSIWIINDLYMPPAIVNTIVLSYNNKYLFKPFMQHYIPNDKQHYFLQGKDDKKAISFNWSDSINSVQIIMNNTVQNDMYNVYLKKTINGKSDTIYISNNWAMSHYRPDPLLNISSAYFNKPGLYEIIVVPEAPDEFNINSMDKAVVIPFTVLPAKSKSFTAMQVLMIIGLVIIIGSGLFLIYYFANKRRAEKELHQKEMAVVQLKSIRSQLNPHFMFNALAGIQNLMNKGDVNATNLYLSKFSRITRNVLDDKHKEQITINDELSLLEDYLQMEQMRFGFNYNIHIDENIDRINTEVPSMLLQPYIENAVKHGVSSLKQAGIIAIAILLKSGSLVMEVKDNGNGYDTHAKPPGNGTVLSEKRVDLINQINKRDMIKITKMSGVKGTIVSIELNNWI